jgi:hypothetical protein
MCPLLGIIKLETPYLEVSDSATGRLRQQWQRHFLISMFRPLCTTGGAICKEPSASRNGHLQVARHYSTVSQDEEPWTCGDRGSSLRAQVRIPAGDPGLGTWGRALLDRYSMYGVGEGDACM